MYSLELSNLDLQVTTNGVNSLVGYGRFVSNNNSVTIAKNSEEDVKIAYYFNATAREISEDNQACYSSEGLEYKTSGTMDMKTWVTDFNAVDLGPWTTTYYC
eukprot:CAMPEP_0185025702 /NCGR_PEP_ID=MMETSP1103-20130426/8874_1 /TAXON_ID=36769 /ORGANISM="Paraphysomonas bandaiensis, Strain Caron Lab Isolate" /LENGTH=101 /DNA_ID=CAMNT_0027558981 /DNA_START=337 /DNA_END=642 /DNA_ORIENTATION=-